MKFVYWGARHYGKSYIVSLFRYNRKTVTRMRIGGKYLSQKYEYYDKDQHFITYCRYVEDSHISKRNTIHTLSSDELMSINTDIGLKTMEFVEEDWLGYGANDPPLSNVLLKTNRISSKIDRDLYPIYQDHGSKWHEHFFNDLCTCDLFVPQPHEELFEYQPFIDYFKTCHNIIAYKSNILDITIARVNLFVSAATNKTFNVNVKNVEDAWYTDKELVFRHLDDFTRNNRNVEQILIDKGIEYDYLNLDDHDYKMFCETELPRTHGVIGYNKDTDRYKLAVTMAKEYLQTRNLTDMRLSGRLQDNI